MNGAAAACRPFFESGLTCPCFIPCGGSRRAVLHGETDIAEAGRPRGGGSQRRVAAESELVSGSRAPERITPGS